MSTGTLAAFTLLGVHKVWAWVVIFGNGMAGAWSLCAVRWTSMRTRSLWWFTAFAETAVFLQVALGLGLVAGQGIDPPAFHPFYGFFAIVCVGLFFAYRRSMNRWVYWLYGIGGIFIMGLGIRAVLVAQG